MRIALERPSARQPEIGEVFKLESAVIEFLTGVSVQDKLDQPTGPALLRIDVLVAAISTCAVLALALATGAGQPLVLSGLLAYIAVVTAAAELALFSGRPGIRAVALLLAALGAPCVAIVTAGDAASLDRAPATIVAMLIGFSIASLVRSRVAIALLVATAVALAANAADAAQAWAAPAAVLAAGAVGLARRGTSARLERHRDEIGLLMTVLAPRESLAATANAAACLIRDAGPFDVTLLGAFTPGGGFRHLAHASRLDKPLPLEPGDLLPETRAAVLRSRVAVGPWVADWTAPAAPGSYDETMYTAGLRLVLYVPVIHDGAIVALLGVGYGERSGATQQHRRSLLFERMAAVLDAATFLGAVMAPQLAELDDRDLRVGAMRALIDGHRYSTVFQPVVELATGAVVGFEALSRFADGERPDLVFRRASDLGLSDELEAATLSAAIAAAGLLDPPSAWLSLNVSPALLVARRVQGLTAGLNRSLVVELTEHEPIADYVAVRAALAELGPTVSVAVDDAGAGFASLRHVLELRPDIVKLDISLVRGVDSDPARQATIAGLVHMAERSSCLVVAEGVETEGERAELLELRVYLGQGFLLGKPAPASAQREMGTTAARPAENFNEGRHTRTAA